MTVHDVIQRSPEWAALRLGLVTGSHAADMLAMTYPEPLKDGSPSKAKPKELAGRRNLRARIIIERLTRKSQDRNFQSQAMADGIEREDAALLKYEEVTGAITRSVGFVSHDALAAGYSPDAVIGDFDGLVEAKCPIPATHFDYIDSGKIPGDYLKQITHGLFVTGAPWCDFISFQPDFPEDMQIRLVRVHRADVDLKDYEAKLLAFLAEVDQKIAALNTARNLAGTLAASIAGSAA